MSATQIVTQTITPPNAPAVPGLTFRRFRGEVDYPEIHRVREGCKEADSIFTAYTLEDIRAEFANLFNCDPYRDMVFAEIDGETIGWGRVWWFQQADSVRIYKHLGWVLPQWRRRGIGSAMIRWQEARLREIAAQHPQDGPRVLESEIFDTLVDLHALLRAMGYHPEVYMASMVRPDLENIPDAPLPEGLEVRPVQPEHLRQIWEADVEAFRDHWGFYEATEEEYRHDFIDFPHLDLSLWRVAWDGDEVAGMVRGFINHAENREYNRRRGWCENISVRRPYRRRGLARALMALTLQEFKRRGMEESALGVHTENPNGAFHLYQSMGFRVVRMETIYQKPME